MHVPPCDAPFTRPTTQETNCSELTLIEMVKNYHDTLDKVGGVQTNALQSASHEYHQISHQFLEDLKKLFEAEQKAALMTPWFKSFQYISSLMTMALGAGLCSTGVAAIAGSILITTGLAGCIHTTLEISDGYKRLSELTSDPMQQEVIKTYLPAMITVSLALGATFTGTYVGGVIQEPIQRTLSLFLPLILNSLQTAQSITKGVFDLHKNQAEAKKIEHEALAHFLENLLEEHQSSLKQTLSAKKSKQEESLELLKKLSTLYNPR